MDKEPTEEEDEGAALPPNPVLASNMEALKRQGLWSSIGGLRKAMQEQGLAIGTGTLQRAVKGQGCGVRTLKKLGMFFNLTADQLLQPELGAGSEGAFIEVPRKTIALSAGAGREAHIEEEVGTLKFRKDFLRSIGASPAKASVVDVVGRSMEPTIPDGAVVLVSGSSTEPRDRLIYALRMGNDLFVKRLVRHGDRWIARSDNDDREAYPDIELVSDDIEIIGRAVWMGAKL